MKRTQRPGVRRGYDLWSRQYDQTANPIVYLDRRCALQALQPQAGEWILDAGCGTGVYVQALQQQRVNAVGVDFSRGMLGVARSAAPASRLVSGDLHASLPFRSASFDAVLCCLVSEHLQRLDVFFAEAHRLLLPGGRLVFSAFHPGLALAGVEANFEISGVEYRLGAETHSTEDFRREMQRAGFVQVSDREVNGDIALVEAIPAARKYFGRPLLLLLEARRN